MSISATLSNALTGLTAASRAAQLVSSNVSNVMTEGYARRELELSARANTAAGDGVRIDGVNRVVDESILRDRRLADASVGSAAASALFFQDLLDLIGLPDDPGGLTAGIANFDAALIEAISRPDSDTRLASVLNSAETLVARFNATNDGIQQLRVDADAQIAAEVSRLNGTLTQIADLNSLILRSKVSGEEIPGLLDQRQVLIDDISALVPVRQIQRENGAVALYSMGGALLLDLNASTFEFEPTSPITADMTLGSGALSGLVLNGEPVDTGGTYSPISGGSLAELFELRDVTSVDAQAGLDALAQDLITRFEDSTLDTSLAVGDPGLFTDAGNPLNLTDLDGLSGRLSVNSLVVPAEGGSLWRLRDGLGAATPGSVGDSSLLGRLSEALDTAQAPVGGGFSGAARSFSGLASDLSSRFGQAQINADQVFSFEQARRDALRDAELSNGVDTDQEMQKLLLIEQAFAANARVVQTADQLIQVLLEL